MSVRGLSPSCLALARVSASPAAFAKSDAKLEAAYVVMGSQGAIAPAVYKGATECPSITVDKSSQQMNVRASPQTGKSAAFPVLVCELLLPAGTTAATLGKQKLPLPPSALGSVAVIGDTGCRLKADPSSSRDTDHEDSPAA